MLFKVVIFPAGNFAQFDNCPNSFVLLFKYMKVWEETYNRGNRKITNCIYVIRLHQSMNLLFIEFLPIITHVHVLGYRFSRLHIWNIFWLQSLLFFNNTSLL